MPPMDCLALPEKTSNTFLSQIRTLGFDRLGVSLPADPFFLVQHPPMDPRLTDVEEHQVLRVPERLPDLGVQLQPER